MRRLLSLVLLLAGAPAQAGVSQAVVLIDNQPYCGGSGTCVAWNARYNEALVLSCDHLWYEPHSGRQQIGTVTVRFPYGGEVTRGYVAFRSQRDDISVLIVRLNRQPAWTMVAAQAPTASTPVWKVGYPLGRGPNLQGGYVLAQQLHTSAYVDSGDSGGGLFDGRGRLVGVVSAYRDGNHRDEIGPGVPECLAALDRVCRSRWGVGYAGDCPGGFCPQVGCPTCPGGGCCPPPTTSEGIRPWEQGDACNPRRRRQQPPPPAQNDPPLPAPAPPVAQPQPAPASPAIDPGTYQDLLGELGRLRAELRQLRQEARAAAGQPGPKGDPGTPGPRGLTGPQGFKGDPGQDADVAALQQQLDQIKGDVATLRNTLSQLNGSVRIQIDPSAPPGK